MTTSLGVAVMERHVLADEVYRVLLSRIMLAELLPGEPVVAAQVAEELDVSSSPVRDALHRLRAEGLIEKQPGGGWSVVCPTLDDMRDVYEAREALEGLAAGLAARQGSDEHLDGLTGVLDELDRCAALSDPGPYVQADMQFHLGIIRSSGNRRLAQWSSAHALVVHCFLWDEPYQDDGLPRPRDPNPPWPTHRDIAVAIHAGDPDAAEELARAHIRQASRRLEGWLARRDGRREPPADTEAERSRGPARPLAGADPKETAEEVVHSLGELRE